MYKFYQVYIMKNSKKNIIKRVLDSSKVGIRKKVDTFVDKNSQKIYGQPVSIMKGKIIKGTSPNFSLIDSIESVRKKL